MLNFFPQNDVSKNFGDTPQKKTRDTQMYLENHCFTTYLAYLATFIDSEAGVSKCKVQAATMAKSVSPYQAPIIKKSFMGLFRRLTPLN
jgi:hypothetical protein